MKVMKILEEISDENNEIMEKYNNNGSNDSVLKTMKPENMY